MSDDAGVPWGGGLAALGMTLGVVALAFVGVSGLQDPDRPVPDEVQQLQAHKRQAQLAEGAPSCGPADLDLVAAVHGPEGEAASHRPDQDLVVWVAAVNTCSTAVAFTTPSLCLFEGFELATEGAAPRGGGTMCAQAITSWTLEPGEAQRSSYTLGNLDAGAYRVRAPFAATGEVAEVAFEVALPPSP